MKKIFVLIALSMCVPAWAVSPFLPDKGHGSLSLTIARSKWEDFTATRGTVGPVYGGAGGHVRDWAYLLGLDYGLADDWAFDMELGIVESKISNGSPKENNRGISDGKFGIRTTLLTPFGNEDEWPKESPIYLSFRLGATLAGTYEAHHHIKPLLNLPGNGDNSIDFSLLPGWSNESDNFTIAGDITYKAGLSNGLDKFKLGIRFEEKVLPWMYLFQSVEREQSYGGYAEGGIMQAHKAETGKFEANHLNEKFNIWNIGVGFSLPNNYGLAVYGGRKFGELINTTTDVRNFNIAITKGF